MIFTLIEATPKFFADKYEVLRGRLPKLYVRRVVTDIGDDFVMMVLLNNDDIVEFLGDMIYEIDKIGSIEGSKTWIANVAFSREGRPMTIEATPRTGFVIAENTSKTSMELAINALKSKTSVLLIANGVQKRPFIIVIYDLSTKDIAAHSELMTTLNGILDSSGLTILHRGDCPPVGAKND